MDEVTFDLILNGPLIDVAFTTGMPAVIQLQNCYNSELHANDQILQIDDKNVHKISENTVYSMLHKKARITLVVRRNLSKQTCTCKCSTFVPRQYQNFRSTSEEMDTLEQPLGRGTNKSKKQKSHEDPLQVHQKYVDAQYDHNEVPVLHHRGSRSSLQRDDRREYNTGEIQADASFSRDFPQQPIGLHNFGYSCYFNATLQILCHTPVLNQMLHESNTKSLTKPRKTTITDAFLNFLSEYFSRTGSHSSKGNLYEIGQKLHSTLVQRSVRFAGTRQQDSHELLRHLLDGIRAEEDEKRQSATSKSAQITTVEKLFCGSFITTFICDRCHPYHLCEPFLDISVPIEPPHYSQEWSEYRGNTDSDSSSVDMFACSERTEYHAAVDVARNELRCAKRGSENSVHDSLAFVTRLETLVEKDYFCPTCNIGRSDDQVTFCNANKRTLIFSPPAILTIHFKRFYQSRSGVYEKIHGHVSYPELLDITPFCSELHSETLKVQPVVYSIYGIVAHSGSLNGGHYMAYIKARSAPDLTMYLQTCDWRDRLKGEAKLVDFYKHQSKSKPAAATGTCRSVQGTWFRISDESVHQLESDVPQLDNAYMLFYERIQ